MLIICVCMCVSMLICGYFCAYSILLNIFNVPTVHVICTYDCVVLLLDHTSCNLGRLATKHNWKAHQFKVFSVTWAPGSSHPLLLTCGAEGEMVSCELFVVFKIKEEKKKGFPNLQTRISALLIECVYLV